MIQAKTRTMVTMIAAIGVVAAGCGDGSLSKSEYVEQNNDIQQRAMDSVNEIGSSSDPSQLAKDLEQAQASLKDAVADLKALDPPADWEDEHADLVAAIEDMDTIMADMKTAADKKDVAALTKASGEISDVQKRASAAISAMNEDR